MDPFCRTEYARGTGHLLRRAPLVCSARFCFEEYASAGEFFYISKLVSLVIKAEGVAGYGLGGPRRSAGDCRPEGPVITAMFVDLESNLNREFVSQGREVVLSIPFSSAGRLAMRTLTERGRHFQAHPLQATFSLFASMLLAGLVVLVLVLSAR
jgi:hypothetical protein